VPASRRPPGYWVVRAVPQTVFSFIRSAMTGFIANVFPSRNRVSPIEAFEGLELGDGKLSRPVLRGLGSREAARPLGEVTVKLPRSVPATHG